VFKKFATGRGNDRIPPSHVLLLLRRKESYPGTFLFRLWRVAQPRRRSHHPRQRSRSCRDRQHTRSHNAAQASANLPPSPLRVRYQHAAASLEKASRERKLTADESADLGTLYVRLGEAGKAVELLRSAQRQYPNHFRIAANLGTAWQVQGNLGEAGAALRQAVRLGPCPNSTAARPHG